VVDGARSRHRSAIGWFVGLTTGYTFDSVKVFCSKDGVITKVPIKEHVPPDVTAQIFWLKNRKPAEWRDAWQMEHVTGRYIISDRPMTEEEWIRERADGDRRHPGAVRTARVIRALGRITAVFPGPRWARDADALSAFLDHARAMGMRLSDAGKWGRSRLVQ
jgi:hypothetical protein